MIALLLNMTSGVDMLYMTWKDINLNPCICTLLVEIILNNVNKIASTD